MPTYRQLTTTHPTYNAERTREYRALAVGGHVLLDDQRLMARVFPQHAHEPAWVYAERKRRAIYLPYAGEIVGELVAQLGDDEAVIRSEPSADPFFEVFAKDCDKQHSSLTTYVQHAVRTALIQRVAWSLVDLPPASEDSVSLGEQERAGALRAYLVSLDTSDVLDWEEDDEGALTWALVRSLRATRTGPEDDRADVVERFTVYDRVSWRRYEIAYRDGRPPAPKTEVPLIDEGTHSFGAVPLVRLELPDGLWALDKVASAARAHFNLNSAVDWSQNKHLFPMMMAFLAPQQGASEEDASKATEQTYGTGFINVFGKDDRVEFVAPSTDVYASAQERLKVLRDEIHRVTHAMALAVDNSAGAIARSGDSKAEDRTAKQVIVRELGRIAREFLHQILVLAQRGRDDAPTTWTVEGLECSDEEDDSQQTINEAIGVSTLAIPSPTFQAVYARSVALDVVGDDATPEEREKIRDEIDASFAKSETAQSTNDRMDLFEYDKATTLVNEWRARKGLAPLPDPLGSLTVYEWESRQTAALDAAKAATAQPPPAKGA
mgnify:CR=1 FL=1